MSYTRALHIIVVGGNKLDFLYCILINLQGGFMKIGLGLSVIGIWLGSGYAVANGAPPEIFIASAASTFFLAFFQ